MEGYSNHHFIAPYIESKQKDFIRGSLYDMGVYPAYKPIGDDLVYGELYKIVHKKEDKILKRIDRLEGHPHLFKREKIPLVKNDGHAWVYIYQGNDRVKIKSGNWKSYSN